MGLGSLFGIKPSRRYASTSSSSYAYDPGASYYPTPLPQEDRNAGGSEVGGLSGGGGVGRRPRGSAASDIGAYGRSSSSSSSAIGGGKRAGGSTLGVGSGSNKVTTSRDYAVAAGKKSSSSASLLEVPSRTSTTASKSQRKATSRGTMSELGMPPSRRPLGTYVDRGMMMDTAAASETSSIYSHRSSLSLGVSGPQSLLTSSNGASGLLSKRDRKRRTLEVQGRAQVFSAADLAPPPPKPKPMLRRNPSTVQEEEDEGGVLDDDGERSSLASRGRQVRSADEIANSAREATALYVSQSQQSHHSRSGGGSQVESATSSQSFAPRSSASSSGGGGGSGDYYANDNHASPLGGSAQSSVMGGGGQGSGRVASPPSLGPVMASIPVSATTQPMVMIREESREAAAATRELESESAAAAAKPPQAPFAGWGDHGQLTPPNSDRGGGSSRSATGGPLSSSSYNNVHNELVTPSPTTIASPISSSGAVPPMGAAPVTPPAVPIVHVAQVETPPTTTTTTSLQDPIPVIETPPPAPTQAVRSLPPTAEELMTRQQQHHTSAATRIVPESPSTNTLFGSADSHDGSNASLASPETPAEQMIGNAGGDSSGGGGGGLAPPVLSVQPPTPMQDHEATPFHSDRAEQPALPSRGTPPPVFGTTAVADLGAPIQTTSSPTNVSLMMMPPPPVPSPSIPSPQMQPAPVPQDPTRPPPIGSLPAPANPSQPHVLKWDPSLQMWTMVPEQPQQPQPQPQQLHSQPLIPKKSPSRAASVVSSVSTYSQQSGMPNGPHNGPRDRRQSLPQLATNGFRPQPMRAPSPSPLTSRPPSPASMGLTSPPPSMYGGARRMSIEPAYSISPTTLTLVPEMKAQDVYPDRPASRSHSRASSVHESQWGGSDSFDRIGMNALAPSLSRYRMGMSPSRLDSLSRPSDSAPPSRSPSESGDELDRPVPSRPASAMGGGSRYAPSLLGGESIMSGSQGGRRRKAGRESALDTMSTRGDSVPLQGADGLDQPSTGYTSLVLPVGSYRPSDPLKSSNKLDPRVVGMPHAAMSTITLSPSAASLSRRSSRTGLFKHESPTPAHLLADLPPPVSFSSHQPPPSKISDSQVLVQVYAVALDRFDSDMVHELSGAGRGIDKWVPGRSFVGRALEVGADVRVIAKGDLVMGVTDIKKSGTLAEFITCERRRIARTPHGSHLSLEQLACLPLYGITAHRACVGLTRGSRALVLNAHEGVGALVTQELSTLGVHVIAQVPVDVASAEEDAWENGAKEVVPDDAIVMINGQHEGSFDLFVDTAGGRRVYDAARRVLRTSGTFVTLIGDDTDHTPASPQIKSGFHALRRAFVKKDKKAINYVHLLPSGPEIDVTGQDNRDVLELPIMGHYIPKVGMVVPFERAPDAFEELAHLAAGKNREESGAVVVRLSN